MIKFVSGNFFDYNADIRINTVNCVGIMGAGAALQFKNKYPKMFYDYQNACNERRVQIGKPHVWINNEIFENEKITIINFPTKDHWRNPSRYEFIEKGLVWLKEFLKSKRGQTITVPALGCGHGGLDWNIVKGMIKNYLEGLELTILVFEPESSIVKRNNLETEKLLIDNKINSLTSISIDYPSKLKGNSNYEVFIKGNLKVFENKTISLLIDSKVDEKGKTVIYECLNNDDFLKHTFILGFNNSFEIDVVKYFLTKKIPIVIALPYGILNLKIRKDLINLWDENLITLISISIPESKWSMPEAIKMFKFRIKLSDALLFTYSELEAISKFKNEIIDSKSHKFYINFWNHSIEFYDQINALKIGKNKETNKPNLLPITATLNKYQFH